GPEVGSKVELVGVAGAGQRHLHRRPDRSVFGAAADPFGGAVIEGDGAAAAPAARERGKRAGLGLAFSVRERCRKQDGGRDQQPPASGASLNWFIGAMLPTARCTVCLQMLHSTSPIR